MKYKVNLTVLLDSINLLKEDYSKYLDIYNNYLNTKNNYINLNYSGNTNDKIILINEEFDNRMKSKLNELADIINYLNKIYKIYKSELDNKKGLNNEINK